MPVLLAVLGLLLGLLLRAGVLAVLGLLRLLRPGVLPVLRWLLSVLGWLLTVLGWLLREALAVARLSRLLLWLLWLAAVHLAVLSSLAVPREVGRLRLAELAVERRRALLRTTLIRPGLTVPVPLL